MKETSNPECGSWCLPTKKTCSAAAITKVALVIKIYRLWTKNKASRWRKMDLSIEIMTYSYFRDSSWCGTLGTGYATNHPSSFFFPKYATNQPSSVVRGRIRTRDFGTSMLTPYPPCWPIILHTNNPLNPLPTMLTWVPTLIALKPLTHHVDLGPYYFTH